MNNFFDLFRLRAPLVLLLLTASCESFVLEAPNRFTAVETDVDAAVAEERQVEWCGAGSELEREDSSVEGDEHGLCVQRGACIIIDGECEGGVSIEGHSAGVAER